MTTNTKLLNNLRDILDSEYPSSDERHPNNLPALRDDFELNPPGLMFSDLQTLSEILHKIQAPDVRLSNPVNGQLRLSVRDPRHYSVWIPQATFKPRYPTDHKCNKMDPLAYEPPTDL